jgi:hypothetical protein
VVVVVVVLVVLCLSIKSSLYMFSFSNGSHHMQCNRQDLSISLCIGVLAISRLHVVWRCSQPKAGRRTVMREKIYIKISPPGRGLDVLCYYVPFWRLIVQLWNVIGACSNKHVHPYIHTCIRQDAVISASSYKLVPHSHTLRSNTVGIYIYIYIYIYI